MYWPFSLSLFLSTCLSCSLSLRLSVFLSFRRSVASLCSPLSLFTFLFFLFSEVLYVAYRVMLLCLSSFSFKIHVFHRSGPCFEPEPKCSYPLVAFLYHIHSNIMKMFRYIYRKSLLHTILNVIV